jgi:hypothetical protein
LDQNPTETTSHDLSRMMNWSTHFHLSHLADRLYLLSLPSDYLHENLLKNKNSYLDIIGYEFYKWTPRVTVEPLKLAYKMWLMVEHLPLKPGLFMMLPKLLNHDFLIK